MQRDINFQSSAMEIEEISILCSFFVSSLDGMNWKLQVDRNEDFLLLLNSFSIFFRGKQKTAELKLFGECNNRISW